MFILPFNRDISDGTTPWIVITLIVLNTLLLPAAYIESKATFATYGFVPAHPSALTLLTSMFLHGGFLHLGGNMFFLWMFGTRVEHRFGRWLFLGVYLASGFAGAALHYISKPSSLVPAVGASGAISGIVGAYFVFFPKSRFDLDVYLFRWRVGTYQTRTHGAVGAWIGEQFLLGLLSQFAPIFSVAFWAHVGGFTLGLGAAAVHRILLPARVERPRRGKHRLDGDFADLDDLDDGKDPFKSDLTLLHLNEPGQPAAAQRRTVAGSRSRNAKG